MIYNANKDLNFDFFYDGNAYFQSQNITNYFMELFFVFQE